MSFAADIRHWRSVAEFETHLAAHAAPAWATATVLHHTWVPRRAQWVGRKSVEGLQRYYESLGWEAGPHLFIAPGGIWQLTPLDTPGIHANSANRYSIGVEVVGDYDAEPWPAVTARDTYGVLTALHRWLGQPAHRCFPHRAFNPQKTCPGKLIDMAVVQAELAHRLRAPADSPAPADLPLCGPPSGSVAQAVAYLAPRAQGYTPSDVAAICAAYARIGDAAGLDWFVALAQLAHETGGLTSWWCQRPRRNPAGIGVTGTTRRGREDISPGRHWAWRGDHWAEGVSFPTWADHAVPAHLGRLLAYAIPAGEGTHEQNELIAAALHLRPLPAQLRGCAPTLRGLDGRWAFPGVGYGARIADLARRIRGPA